jgi:hypothetical protein
MPRARKSKTVKNGLCYRPPTLQVLDNDPLEEIRRHPCIPDPVGVNDDDRSITAHAEAWCLAALDPCRSEQQVFTLKELG